MRDLVLPAFEGYTLRKIMVARVVPGLTFDEMNAPTTRPALELLIIGPRRRWRPASSRL